MENEEINKESFCELIDLDTIDGGSEYTFVRQHQEVLETDEPPSTLTEEEKDFARVLAQFTYVQVEGWKVKGRDVIFSPLGISVLAKLHPSSGRAEISAMGAKDLRIDNLSVISNGIKKVTGSGTRLATEWWEKCNGYELTTVKIQGTIVAIFFYHGWKMARCTEMLYEGAELCDTIVYIREDITTPFAIEGYKFDIIPVRKYNFSTPIPLGIEGIMVMVDYQMWRLKEVHTIDLRAARGALYNREGERIGSTEYTGTGIVEVTLDLAFVKERKDKTIPDSKGKINTIRQLPTLKEFRGYISHLEREFTPYIPTQWVGYEFFSSVSGEPQAIAENLFWEQLTPDQRPVCLNYIIQRVSKKSQYIPYVTEEVSIASSINHSYKKLDFPKFINKLKRAGYSFNIWELRKFLIRHGVRICYEHFDIAGVPYGRELVPYPKDNYIHLPKKIDTSYIQIPCRVVGGEIYRPMLTGYYHTSLQLAQISALESYLQEVEEDIPILEAIAANIVEITFIPEGEAMLALKVAILNALFVDGASTCWSVGAYLRRYRVLCSRYVVHSVLTELRNDGWIINDGDGYTLGPLLTTRNSLHTIKFNLNPADMVFLVPGPVERYAMLADEEKSPP